MFPSTFGLFIAASTLFIYGSCADEEITQNDKTACKELNSEYNRICRIESRRQNEEEFCRAFENVCVRLLTSEKETSREGDRKIEEPLAIRTLAPMSASRSRPKPEPYSSTEEDPDPNPTARSRSKPSPSAFTEEVPQFSTASRPSPHKKRIDFTDFCVQFKNRYLFVCPNPFRFGQKAVVFCPIYSERCHVPLPEKPVVPSSGRKNQKNNVQRLCASYSSFANQYCNNPLFLAQPQYRSSCEKYRRFCTPRN